MIPPAAEPPAGSPNAEPRRPPPPPAEEPPPLTEEQRRDLRDRMFEAQCQTVIAQLGREAPVRHWLRTVDIQLGQMAEQLRAQQLQINNLVEQVAAWRQQSREMHGLVLLLLESEFQRQRERRGG